MEVVILSNNQTHALFMMYINKIRLEDIRCFEEVEIDFGKPGNSVLICGNNGSGKTALLRSIAMGLCDQISAGALLRDLPGDFIRKKPGEDERNAVISVDLFSTENNENFEINTTLRTRATAGFEQVYTNIKKTGSKDKIDPYDFPWREIFVTGYGAGLRTNGSEDYAQYFAPDAVYSLFEYTYPLHNPELAWRRFIDVSRDSVSKEQKDFAEESINKLIIDTLKNILVLDNEQDDISLGNNGIFIQSLWGKHELDALGDGYRALVTLTMDILAWKLLAKNHKAILRSFETNEEQVWEAITDLSTLEGIVIIDEVEKHLHPRLQHNIISHLKQAFPRIQFIITTHSPLCVSGVADVEKDGFTIYSTRRKNDGSVTLKLMPSPSGLTADDIFRTYFEIGDTRNRSVKELLVKFDELYQKAEKSDEEKSLLETIKTELQEANQSFEKRKRKILESDVSTKLDAILKALDKND